MLLRKLDPTIGCRGSNSFDGNHAGAPDNPCAWPLAARAQQSAMPMIAFLRSTSAAGFEHLVAGFEQGLKEGEFVAGQNIGIDYRWANDRLDRLPELAADLIRRQPAGNKGRSRHQHGNHQSARPQYPAEFVYTRRRVDLYATSVGEAQKAYNAAWIVAPTKRIGTTPAGICSVAASLGQCPQLDPKIRRAAALT